LKLMSLKLMRGKAREEKNILSKSIDISQLITILI
jgi:hypothetical protein